MDKSSRRPPPPPPDSNSLPPVPPPPRDPAAPPLPRRNQAPPPIKETLNDFYEDMSPPKGVSPGLQRKYGSTQQPVGLLGGLVHVSGSENDQGKKKNTFLDTFRSLESKLQLNKPEASKWNSSFLDKDRKISEPQRPLQTLLPFSVEKVRRATVGDSTHTVHENSDDTYEIPEVNIPEPRLPPRPDTGAKPIARPSPPESDSDDGEWDEDWDDAQTDPKQGDGLYIVPDGGNVEEDPVQQVEDDPAPPPPPPNNRRRNEQLQQANVQQLNSKALLTPPHKPAQTPMAAELKLKLSIFQSNKPVPPPKTDKPQPPAKPVEIKPHLPPRSHEKLPPVPPIDTIDGKSDDNSSEGSTSSGTTPSIKPLKMNSPSGQVIRNQAKVLVFPAVHATIKKIEEQVSKFPSKLPNNVPPEPEEIYDDATTEILTSYAWYHGELDRKEAEKRVSQLRENGAFLVRASTKANPTNPYVLVVLSEGKTKNLQLRQRNDKRFAIGNYKQDEVAFNTVPDLVTHHKTNNIKLADGGTVMLTQTPQKQYRD